MTQLSISLSLIAGSLVFLGFLARLFARLLARRQRTLSDRLAFINTYPFSDTLLHKVQARHPQLSAEDLQGVARALRAYFRIHLQHPQAFLGMPSVVVDDLWHALILDTRAYQSFCDQAFGHFLHHIPNTPTTPGQRVERSLCTTWDLACKDQGIEPSAAMRQPWLFEIDAALAIKGGNRYIPKDGTRYFNACGGAVCGSGSAKQGQKAGGGAGSDTAFGGGCSGDGGDGGGCGGS